RPCTSLEAIDDKARPKEKTANAATMRSPAWRPVARSAVAEIAATAPDWTRAPATRTHLRRGAPITSGDRNTWGNIDPDSRIGTSRPIRAVGAPSVTRSQGSTVEALTVWSPDDCSALPPAIRKPLAGTESR